MVRRRTWFFRCRSRRRRHRETTRRGLRCGHAAGRSRGEQAVAGFLNPRGECPPGHLVRPGVHGLEPREPHLGRLEDPDRVIDRLQTEQLFWIVKIECRDAEPLTARIEGTAAGRIASSHADQHIFCSSVARRESFCRERWRACEAFPSAFTSRFAVVLPAKSAFTFPAEDIPPRLPRKPPGTGGRGGAGPVRPVRLPRLIVPRPMDTLSGAGVPSHPTGLVSSPFQFTCESFERSP